MSKSLIALVAAMIFVSGLCLRYTIKTVAELWSGDASTTEVRSSSYSHVVAHGHRSVAISEVTPGSSVSVVVGENSGVIVGAHPPGGVVIVNGVVIKFDAGANP